MALPKVFKCAIGGDRIARHVALKLFSLPRRDSLELASSTRSREESSLIYSE